MALNAQVGGSTIFSFLTLPSSSRAAALGGLYTSSFDEDVNLAFQNPAILNETMNNHLALNSSGYLSNAKYKFLNAAHSFSGIGNFALAFQNLDYGKFDETNNLGVPVGVFTANETSIQLSYSHLYKTKISFGVNAKFVASHLADYLSTGVCFDAGVLYHDSTHQFNSAFVVKNMGTQLTTYSGTKEKLPFDIEAGISKRLEHTPFIVSLNLHHLQTFNIRYDDPNIINNPTILGDTTTVKDKKYVVDKLFRHAIIGTEIVMGRNLRFDIGYNHMRRQELSFAQRRGIAGFSFGAAIRVKRFQLAYSHAVYNISGGTDNFSLLLNLNQMFGKN